MKNQKTTTLELATLKVILESEYQDWVKLTDLVNHEVWLDYVVQEMPGDSQQAKGGVLTSLQNKGLVWVSTAFRWGLDDGFDISESTVALTAAGVGALASVLVEGGHQPSVEEVEELAAAVLLEEKG